MSFKSAKIVLEGLSQENRRIATIGRAMLALRAHYPLSQLSRHAKQALAFLERNGLIEAIPGTRAFYKVTAPFVGSKELNPYELVMEAYYDGILAYSTALELHQLTDQRFRTLHVLVPDRKDEDMRLLGTSLYEWELLLLPTPSRIKEMDEYTIVSHRMNREWSFGYEIMKPHGFPLRVIDIERTLIDGLRHAKHCGGLDEVFRAWVRAYDLLDVGKIVSYAEKYDIGVLYQRVGFVLETMGLTHPQFLSWRENHVQRGGSRVLDPERPFSGGRFDERWALSINHPVSILEQMDASYS